MARPIKKSKSVDVAKFGGIEELGQVKTDLHSNLDGTKNTYEASKVEAQSKTNLEFDEGEGDPVILRRFTFQMNLEHPELFIQRRPSKQDLFNAHIKGIEMALWKDGMKLYTDVAPRITFDTKKFQYSIFIAARPQKGYLLQERPQTLSEIVHG